MQKFKDKKGGVWTIDVDLEFITRVKRACGINVVDLVMGEAGKGLAEDPEKVGQLLWSICEPEALGRGTEPENFPKLFNGEAIDNAVIALSLAVRDFLSPSRQALATKILEKGNQVAEAARATVLQKIESIDVSKLVTKLSGGPTGSAESPESTQAT